MFTPNRLGRTALAVATLLGSAAHAAEPEPDFAPDAPGFALIEHRIAIRQPTLAPAATVHSMSALRPHVAARRPATSLARERVLPWINSAENRHRLPLGLLDALIATESAYLPFAVSRAGAAGLAQLMPGTAVDLGVTDRFDPVQSIEGGARYLRQMLDRFGSVSLALAAYNAGPGAVAKAGGIPGNRETPVYVSRVIGRWLSSRESF
ncbi:lytic transglycosylase domain-containing protein [Sphingomonas lenta]|uniref:Lytic transglycosylase n=1 Tax=Sphingomonas lenta TaxID=1141887 RepID=A0A2A2SIH1_9SPHN|nr:lytic transglycosylase domain-containing protein [Sphingomonas lenta]PAX09029.1 lytic transglycosylase [Sphingomonas lenta]